MQAPIGPAATHELVAAVSRSGALGTLAASWTPIGDLRDQVNWLRSTSDAPFCVNLVLAFEQRPRLIAALEGGTSLVSFSWGTDPGLIGLARTAGAFVLVQVGDAGEATDAVRAGADALIVQGVEAGGHVQASRPVVELLHKIRAAVHIPVLPSPAGPSSLPPKKQMFTLNTSTACAEPMQRTPRSRPSSTVAGRTLHTGSSDMTRS
jgi:nitronate monooxygenase